MQKPLVRIIRKNTPSSLKEDLYHSLFQMSWPKTVLLVIFTYVSLNAIFAFLYWLSPGCLTNWDGRYLSAFYFSVQTLGTIGYGVMSPQTDYANILVTIEAILGLMILAVMTGIFFAKFATPYARLHFTDSLLIRPYNGKTTLMFRTINLRENSLIDVKATLVALKDEVTSENTLMKRFKDLKLVRSQVPVLSMSMTFMHVIDDESPLFGLDQETLQKATIDFFITIVGVDGTFGQTIHATKAYTTKNIVWNREYADVITTDPDGVRHIDFSKFHLLK